MVAHYCLYFVYKEKKEIETFRDIELLAKKLKDLYRKNHSEGWDWFDDKVTYGNAIIPLSLLLASVVTEDAESKEIAEVTMGFLLDNLKEGSVAAPVGEKGWWKKGKE